MAHLVFGEFELDPASGELRKGNDCIRLQDQPLKLLLCLLGHPGQLVTREELHQRIWGNQIHVDFDDGLNAAAWRLRQALGDSPDEPAYIETIPRKGYRFVGKVLPRPGKAHLPSESFPMPVYRPDSGRIIAPASPTRSRKILPWVWIGGGLTLGLAIFGLWSWSRPRASDLTPSILVLPLRNGTGDPAMDYVAAALGRDVADGLRSTPGLGPLSGGEGLPQGKTVLRLEWTLLRDGGRFRIPVNLVSEGQIVAGEVVLLEPGELGSAGKRISSWASAQKEKGGR
jgi:DNA-binding winged helix-turn-helix (wHTH) protein